jgi:hypothetical protein
MIGLVTVMIRYARPSARRAMPPILYKGFQVGSAR